MKIKELQETKPMWHAMIWIITYIVLVNFGNNISDMTGSDNSATAFILAAFSIVLLLYIKKNNWFEAYGFKGIEKSDLKKTLFYIPLIVMAFIQYFKGIDHELGFVDIGLGIVLMICVGLIEELIFRGFLYQGILKKSGMTRAIIISGVTFGMGHVVNLIQGYLIADQIIQIAGAVMLGIVLALLIAVTKNIIPGVIFHILFNISGTITKNNLKMEIYIVGIVMIISALYCIYLRKSLNQQDGRGGAQRSPL